MTVMMIMMTMTYDDDGDDGDVYGGDDEDKGRYLTFTRMWSTRELKARPFLPVTRSTGDGDSNEDGDLLQIVVEKPVGNSNQDVCMYDGGGDDNDNLGC